MGSPLGPLFADIYVNYIEHKLMPRLKRNGVLYWRRFVDDTFIILEEDSNVNNIVEILNSFDNKIQFTVEPESNYSLPFLDIQITRNSNNNLSKQKNNNEYDTSNFNSSALQNNNINNKTNNSLFNLNNNNSNNSTSENILVSPKHNSYNLNYNNVPNLSIDNHPESQSLFTTTIFRKPTYTGLIMKWNSFILHSYKVSTISTYRAIRICSSYKLMHEEFKFIVKTASQNGYPKSFVKLQIGKTLERYINKSKAIKNNPTNRITDNKTNTKIKKEQIFIDIPFYGKPTNVLGKRLIKLGKTITSPLNVEPIQRRLPSLSNFFPIKDSIPKILQSNLVHQANCSNCESTYIGKTVRHAFRRFNEHGANLKKNKKKNNNNSEVINYT